MGQIGAVVYVPALNGQCKVIQVKLIAGLWKALLNWTGLIATHPTKSAHKMTQTFA